MKNEVVGYKCFNKDHTNRYGMEFVVGRTYTSASSDVSFGNNNKSGYHMCKNLEDTFRYFPADSEEISVARVRGSGNIITRDDEYNGFYDMYSVERLHIDKFLTREEIINYFLDKDITRVCRFIQLFKLTNEEINLYMNAFSSSETVINYIMYYQLGDKDIFNKSYKGDKQIFEKTYKKEY